MKNIKDLSKDLTLFQKRLKNNLIKAQMETAKKAEEDVKKHLGHSSGKYADSIKIGETKQEEGKISTEIYTDLLSKDGYAVGRMIENGTGIYALEPHIGHTKAFHDSQYQYWYVPADEVDRPIGKEVEIQGMKFYIAKAQKPKPHWKPALDENIQTYKENISKAVKESL